MTRNLGGLQLPRALGPGSTLGVFSPSTPAHVTFADKTRHGLHALRELGFHVTLAPLLRRGAAEGYRTASGQARADDLHALLADPRVDAVVSTIGGANSSSLLPHLDLALIRASGKGLCGFSDVTALHLAWRRAGVASWYGPAVMPTFGEWPRVDARTREGFLAAVGGHPPWTWTAPDRWSAHFRDATTDAWRAQPREWSADAGWRILRPGCARGPIVAANLNTLCALAGTPFWPALRGAVLLVEQGITDLATEERRWRQLELVGALDEVVALLVGRPERLDPQGAPFDLGALIEEILGDRALPVVLDVDCGHTLPMATIAQGTACEVDATERGSVRWLEPMASGAPTGRLTRA